MATRTANTGSNNWNTNAAWVGGVQPTAADDVIIPATAVVTIPTATTVLGRSVTVQASGTLAFTSGTSVLTIGDATAGAGSVALSISSSATITLTASDGVINFISTSTTQQTITSGGKTLPNITINGVGGKWILGDALIMVTTGTTVSLNHNAGTFNTGNFNITTLILNSNVITVRTLTLGSSAISLIRNGTAMQINPTNLTITANTAVFTATLAATINGGNANFNGASLVYTGSGVVSLLNGGTWLNVTRTGTASKSDSFQIATAGFTCTDTFTVTSNSNINRVLVFSDIRGSARTITAASVILSNTVDFMDITGAGAATWTKAGTGAIEIGDALGNSNITFTTSQTNYFVGTSTGNWSDAARWATTSGGTGGTGRVPLPQDDVILDSNSAGAGSRLVSVDMPRAGRNITTQNALNNQNITAGLSFTMYGSYTNDNTWGNSFSSVTVTFSGRSSHTLTMPAIITSSSLTITAPNGTYTIASEITMSGPSAKLTLTAGTFNTANYDINMSGNAASGYAQSGGILNLGTSTILLSGQNSTAVWSVTGGVVNGGSSTIIIANASTNTRTFAGFAQTYGTLQYTVAASTGQLNVTGSNTFTTIEFSDVTNARSIAFTSGTTQTITNFNVTGTSGKLMTVKSITGGSVATLSKPSGGLLTNTDYLSVQDISVIQPLSFFAGVNSTDVSGNSGVYFSMPGTFIFKQSVAATPVTGTSITNAYLTSTTPGNLLIAEYTSAGTGGTVTPPAGWSTAIFNPSTSGPYIFYKIANGLESTASVSQTISRPLLLTLSEYSGFTGTPTLDVTDTNLTGTATTSLSTTASTGPTNTTSSALAFAMVGNPSTLAATVSLTNNFVEDKTVTNGGSQNKAVVKVLTTMGPVETTFTWVTARSNSVAVLAVFKDVVTAGSNGNFFRFF